MRPADLPGGVPAALVAKAVAIPARRSAENSAKYASSVTDMANMTYRAAWQAAVHAETGASKGFAWTGWLLGNTC